MDVEEASVDSFYISVFASAYIPLHMGKTETAHELLEKHVGVRLTVRFSVYSLIQNIHRGMGTFCVCLLTFLLAPAAAKRC